MKKRGKVEQRKGVVEVYIMGSLRLGICYIETMCVLGWSNSLLIKRVRRHDRLQSLEIKK